MSYTDAFATVLANKGLSVDVSVIPEQEAVNSDLDGLGSWLSSLDDDTHAAIDLITADNPIKAALADPSVGIVQAIGPLLTAFDNQLASISISSTLDMLTDVSTQAAASINNA